MTPKISPRLLALSLSVAHLSAQIEGWQQITTSHNMGPRSVTAMAFDAVRGNIVLFAGASSNPVQDTWTYDGVDWTQRFPTTVPYGNTNHAMAWDPVRQRVVMCSSTYTWEWDGTNWSQLDSS